MTSSLQTLAVAAAALLLGACAAPPDRFYRLDALAPAPQGQPAPTLQMRLQVTIPALIDRSEMVLSPSANGVVVLEHERWGAPLSEQIAGTLARDIERHNAGWLVTDAGLAAATASSVSIHVDIVHMTAAPGAQASMEAHWRIVDSTHGIDRLGSRSFQSPVTGSPYAAVAAAYSELLAGLADTLAAELTTR